MVRQRHAELSDDVARASPLLTEAIEADRERYPDDPMAGHYLGYLENRPEEVTGALRSIATAPVSSRSAGASGAS